MLRGIYFLAATARSSQYLILGAHTRTSMHTTPDWDSFGRHVRGASTHIENICMRCDSHENLNSAPLCASCRRKKCRQYTQYDFHPAICAFYHFLSRRIWRLGENDVCVLPQKWCVESIVCWRRLMCLLCQEINQALNIWPCWDAHMNYMDSTLLMSPNCCKKIISRFCYKNDIHQQKHQGPCTFRPLLLSINLNLK